MPLLSLPAVFMRGGTSRAIMFHARDLPDRAEWDPIFLAAMGSPDPNGRQLNGMGGGISSLSKVCILAPSDRADADIDYTFAQVQIREPRVDYRSNCGNMSSAVGPFAVDEGHRPAEWRHRRGAHFQHQHAQDHPLHLPAGRGRLCRHRR